MTTEFQGWLQIAVLACLAFLGLGRALILNTRKIRVFVLDSQMTKTQLLNGMVFVFCFVTWIFEAVTHGLSLDYHIPSAILHTVLIQHIGIRIVAIIILILGLLIYALALLSFGDSWRIGIDREKSGNLVTTGIFSWSRNPIYISLGLLALGTFLLQGHLIFLILTICIVVSLHIQILEEEKFLTQVHGEIFLNYCSRVGRYFKFK